MLRVHWLQTTRGGDAAGCGAGGRTAAVWRLALPCLWLAVCMASCTHRPPPPPGTGAAAEQQNAQRKATDSAREESGARAGQNGANPASQSDPTADAGALLVQAEQNLERGDLERARALLAQAEKRPEFAAVRDAALKLEARVAQAEAARARAQREAALARASELLAAGDLENALASLETVKALGPTAEERAQADQLIAEIERRRRVRRKLLVAMQLLGSSQRSEVRAAQSELFAEPEVALPLLLEAVRSEQPTLVSNALEMLRRLNRPEIALPAMVGVLGRQEQRESWPAAIRELSRTQAAGAGPALLELAIHSNLPDQRAAALAALAQVPDPPEHTLPAVLPLIEEDGPELSAALEAAAHAVLVHDQQDLAARRGLSALDRDAEDRLARLGTRLHSLAARAQHDAVLATAAARLALCTRLMAPQPLEGVKLASFSGELPASPAAAVLDGVWNSTAHETQWRLPASQRAALVLDLGQPRLVCGVKVWNLNEPGGTHRGWKDVEVYVSDAPAPLAVLAEGLVLPAPGSADAPDYGTYIPLPPTMGRYVKLQARNTWRDDSYKGLAEVQVWGLAQ